MKSTLKRILALALLAALALTMAVPALAEDYKDVPKSAWYAQAVAYCDANGLMQGYGDGWFGPGDAVDRAAVAAVLHRVSGAPAPLRAEIFSDVADGAWYADAVNWAYDAAITDGYGDGRFGPTDAVTREQLTALLYRAYGSGDVSAAAYAKLDKFPDAKKVSAWARSAMAWAVDRGIISGYNDGRLRPGNGADRAQLATILSRIHAAPAYVSVMDVFCAPVGLAKTERGDLLVADSYNKVVWKLHDGAAAVYAGADTPEDLSGQPVGGYNDAALEASYFRSPWAIAPFLGGWAVSDPDNDVVRLLQPDGTATLNGSTTEALRVTRLGVAFSHPTGLAADDEGNLYVSDTWNGAVRRITPKGKVTTVASGLNDPTGLCWRDGVLYVAETGANRVVKYENGVRTPVAGSGAEGLENGAAGAATFAAPQGVAVDDKGTVYVADTGNSAVRMVRDGKVTTLCARGWGSEALCPVSPKGLLVDDGRLYVCDEFSRRVFTLTIR